ncbi:MurR/RpiR family transcriptional regulator [Rubrimonas cliftonensis]|uniref:Transcriptional regulator, RpiR family n=1 Tax=Rubrimonas cliftonensis TaxID=89524 RepID=A0A1H3XHX3_9RHOB|nr:MurR/RpiR family transcriptional regulator [Rubrimonas cliftonensis]SDZ99025.1 transcriptional regulator, RpiR family [Rubrimonas cliftonensis]
MTVREMIEQNSGAMTPAERKLATSLLSDYPYAGLLSIQELADRSEVSAPSISRFVAKIGLCGYPELQRRLLSELREGERSPVEIRAKGRRIENDFLGEFIDRAAAQMRSARGAITEAQFRRVRELLGDRRRAVFVLGGRISDAIATHLSFHLRQAREGVHHLPRDPEAWPDHLLRMRPGDVFFLVDFRRYQPALARLAEQAAARRALVVLLTDRWLSPANRHAAEVLAAPIENGALWDSYCAALAVVEALATAVAEDDWEHTRARIGAWDAARPTERETRP